MNRPVTVPLRALIRVYQLVLSPWLGANCRFQPSCSGYAQEALARHGAVRGGWLTLKRIGRCHPWGGSGFDPVPVPAPSQLLSPVSPSPSSAPAPSPSPSPPTLSPSPTPTPSPTPPAPPRHV